MRIKYFIYIILFLLVIVFITALFLFIPNFEQDNRMVKLNNFPDKEKGFQVIELPAPDPEVLQLAVPYINEAPEGKWVGPWKNACEEASITMVEKFYQGKNEVTVEEAKEFMMMLFEKQFKIWGSDRDADAERAVRIINDFTSYTAVIKDNPTIEDIKKEIIEGHPVISLHYGKDLNNPNIPFLATGSYYHMMVIIGFDDLTQEFITNDDGDTKTGAAHRYDYYLFLKSLHDFDFKSQKANGPARVIFTSPK